MGTATLPGGGKAAVEKVINRAGFKKLEAELWEYYVLPEAWRSELCKGFDATTIANAMIAANWMTKGDGKHLACKTRITGHGTTRVFRVLSGFMAGDDTLSFMALLDRFDAIVPTVPTAARGCGNTSGSTETQAARGFQSSVPTVPTTKREFARNPTFPWRFLRARTRIPACASKSGGNGGSTGNI